MMLNYSNINRLFFLLAIVTVSCSGNNKTPDIRIAEQKTVKQNYTLYKQGIKPLYHIDLSEYARINNTAYKAGNDVGYIRMMDFFDIDQWGRIFITNGALRGKSQSVVVFGPEGKYISSVGRAGRGPGEFVYPSELKIRGNQLYIYDDTRLRIIVYRILTPGSDKIAVFSHSVVLNSKNWDGIPELKGTYISGFYPRTDNNILMAFKKLPSSRLPDKKGSVHYYLTNSKGKIISGEVFKHKNVNFFSGTGIQAPQFISSFNLPFTRSYRVAVSPEGNIFIAWTGDFIVKEYNAKGKFLRAFQYPYSKSSLDKAEVLERYKSKSARFLKRVRSVGYPDTWPAINQMLLDDRNRLWIATITEDKESYEWWVTDEYGKLLAKFKWPGHRLYRNNERQGIKKIKNGYLYDLKINKENGDQSIVKYKISFTSNEY